MGLIKELIGGGIKGIGDAVSGVINSINAPKEERERVAQAIQAEINRHAEVLLNASTDLEKSYLQDVQDSRGANAKIQESANASWMAKNIAYLIDILVTVAWTALTSYLIVVMLNLAPKQVGVDYTAVTAVWGAVTGVFTQVLSFHRGSSRGSEKKQELIDKMSQKA